MKALPIQFDESIPAWEKAIYAFLAEKERRSGSMRTVDAYTRTLQRFFGTAGKTPEQVTPPDVFGSSHGIGPLLSACHPRGLRQREIGRRIAARPLNERRAIFVVRLVDGVAIQLRVPLLKSAFSYLKGGIWPKSLNFLEIGNPGWPLTTFRRMLDEDRRWRNLKALLRQMTYFTSTCALCA
jgi:hypothetical protein